MVHAITEELAESVSEGEERLGEEGRRVKLEEEAESTSETPPPASSTPPAPPQLAPDESATYQSYRMVDNRFRTDPEFARRVQQVFGPPVQSLRPQPTPSPNLPNPPDYSDLDPHRQSLPSTPNSPASTPSSSATTPTYNITQQRENDAAISPGRQGIVQDSAAHDLTDAQMSKVYNRAGTYAPVVGTLLSQGRDTQSALTEVFGLAYYWQIPTCLHETSRQQAQAQADFKCS